MKIYQWNLQIHGNPETIKTYPKETIDEHEGLISELKNKIISELSFIKHLVNEDSPFVKAMIEGSWVN